MELWRVAPAQAGEGRGEVKDYVYNIQIRITKDWIKAPEDLAEGVMRDMTNQALSHMAYLLSKEMEPILRRLIEEEICSAPRPKKEGK